ncbi:MAG: DUF192 domain-containing protein [Erythrobacter sp.]
MVKWFSLLVAGTLAACSATESVPATAQVVEAQEGEARTIARSKTHPISQLPLIEVTVNTGEKRVDFVTEVANTHETQSRGLMFRTELGDFDAMIFPSGRAQPRSFWMKNTPLPLDIIFIGPDRRITNIEAGVPYSTDSVHSDGPALAVFEIRGGRAEALGIEPGDLVEWALPR